MRQATTALGRLYLLVFGALVSLAGCAKSVSLPVWQPATIDVDGVRSIAVAHLAGEPELADSVRERIMQRIGESGFYHLVNPPDWRHLLPRESQHLGRPATTHDAIVAAQRLGVDAVLVGRVSGKADWGEAKGNVAFRLGDPEVAVLVEYQVIDVRSGAVRGGDSVFRSFSGDLSIASEQSEKVEIQRLAMQCADAVVNDVIPHQETIEVPLETATMGVGATAIRAGNELARNGQWAEAQEKWQSAVDENTENDEAIYNLGLSHEALGDFAAARHLYQSALNLSNDSTYEEALKRVESAARNDRLAKQQLARLRPQQVARSPQQQIARSPQQPVARPPQQPLARPHEPRQPAAQPTSFEPVSADRLFEGESSFEPLPLFESRQ